MQTVSNFENMKEDLDITWSQGSVYLKLSTACIILIMRAILSPYNSFTKVNVEKVSWFSLLSIITAVYMPKSTYRCHLFKFYRYLAINFSLIYIRYMTLYFTYTQFL